MAGKEKTRNNSDERDFVRRNASRVRRMEGVHKEMRKEIKGGVTTKCKFVYRCEVGRRNRRKRAERLLLRLAPVLAPPFGVSRFAGSRCSGQYGLHLIWLYTSRRPLFCFSPP